jgi:hypothetical protein
VLHYFWADDPIHDYGIYGVAFDISMESQYGIELWGGFATLQYVVLQNNLAWPIPILMKWFDVVIWIEWVAVYLVLYSKH